MTKPSNKKFTKEWLELTLCDMVDEVLAMMRNGENRENSVKRIKNFAGEIYDLSK